MFLDATHPATSAPRASSHARSLPSTHAQLESPLLTQVVSAARNLCQKFEPRLIDAKWVASRTPLLHALAKGIAEHEDTLASLLSAEGQRPIAACRVEAKRSVQTLLKTIEALARLAEPRALDFSDAIQGGHHAFAQRFTCGPLCAIVPFNFPLNLALHKVAPALALGLPFVCKGPDQNSKTMALLAHLVEKAGVPSEDFLFFQSSPESAEALLEEVPFPLISFTGSQRVGLHLKQKFWDRKVMLELGSTAALLVCDDVPRWELEPLAQRIARSAFGQGGQSCISLQHLFLEPEVALDLISHLKDATTRLAEATDLSHPDTVCGPVVSKAAAAKIEDLLANAQQNGATLWRPPGSPHSAKPNHNDTHTPAHVPPTLVFLPQPPSLEASPLPLRLLREEAFGPVLCIHRLPSGGHAKVRQAALASVDANIHASIFTYDAKAAKTLFEASTCHALLWNELPSWRADAMPYGGTVARSLTRTCAPLGHTGLVGGEGPLYAMQEYTWERLFVMP